MSKITYLYNITYLYHCEMNFQPNEAFDRLSQNCYNISCCETDMPLLDKMKQDSLSRILFTFQCCLDFSISSSPAGACVAQLVENFRKHWHMFI